MTKRDALSIALKVLGVTWLVYAVQYAAVGLPQVLSYFNTAEPQRSLMVAVQTGSALVHLGTAGVLLHYTDRLTAVLVPDDAELRLLPLEGSAVPLLQVAIRIMGVILAAGALARLPSSIYGAVVIADSAERAGRVPAASSWSLLMEPAGGLAVGLLLVLAAGWLARAIARGEPEPEPEEAQR